MADQPRYEAGAGADRGASTSTPRWVKVSGIVAVVVVLLLVGVMLFGGEGHGPGRHLGPGQQTAPADVSEQSGGHTGPPAGVEHGRQQP